MNDQREYTTEEARSFRAATPAITLIHQGEYTRKNGDLPENRSEKGPESSSGVGRELGTLPIAGIDQERIYQNTSETRYKNIPVDIPEKGCGTLRV